LTSGVADTRTAVSGMPGGNAGSSGRGPVIKTSGSVDGSLCPSALLVAVRPAKSTIAIRQPRVPYDFFICEFLTRSAPREPSRPHGTADTERLSGRLAARRKVLRVRIRSDGSRRRLGRCENEDRFQRSAMQHDPADERREGVGRHGDERQGHWRKAIYVYERRLLSFLLVPLASVSVREKSRNIRVHATDWRIIQCPPLANKMARTDAIKPDAL
jgi:hypothetical protein